LAKQLLKEVQYSTHPIRLIGLSVSHPIEEQGGNDMERGLWEQLSFEFSDWKG
jgi:DNA polymerase-4